MKKCFFELRGKDMHTKTASREKCLATRQRPAARHWLVVSISLKKEQATPQRRCSGKR
jgi:hypothetical protein